MGLRSVLSEAWRNVVTGTSRSLTFALLLAASAGTLALADGAAVQRILSDGAKFQASGASTMILSAQAGIDGAQCDRLGEIDGVMAAGAVRDGEATAAFPFLATATSPLREATAGFLDLLRPATAHDLPASLIVSEQVAALWQKRTGDEVNTTAGPVTIDDVYAYPDDGRSADLEYAVVVLAPPDAPFDECWMRVWPTNGSTTQLLRLALRTSVSSNEGVMVRQLNAHLGADFPGDTLYADRPTALAAPISVVVGLLIGFFAIRFRRLELASARHCGVSIAAQFLQVLVETVLLALGAVLMVLPALLWHAGSSATTDVAAVAWIEVRCVLAAGSCTVLGALVCVASVRERYFFRYFKNRE